MSFANIMVIYGNNYQLFLMKSLQIVYDGRGGVPFFKLSSTAGIKIVFPFISIQILFYVFSCPSYSGIKVKELIRLTLKCRHPCSSIRLPNSNVVTLVLQS